MGYVHIKGIDTMSKLLNEDIYNTTSPSVVSMNEELMLSFFSIMPDNVVIMNKALDVVLCNKAALGFFECKNEADFTQHLLEYFPKAENNGIDAKEKLAQMAKCAFEQGIYEDDWIYIDKNGNRITLNVRMIGVHPQAGIEEPYLLSVMHDISRFVTREEKEVEFSSTLKAILDATPLALNMWDTQMNNILCNRQVLNIFGLESEEDYQNNFHKFSPEYQPNGKLSAEMIEQNLAIAKKEGVHRFKWMHLDSEGGEIPAEITLTKVNISEGKDHLVGFVRDLRGEFDQNHEENDDDYYFLNRIPEKSFLSKVAEISDDLFFAIDRRTHTIQFLGKPLQSLTQNSQSKTVTSTAYNEAHVHEDDLEIYKELVQNMGKGICKPLELRFIQPDGSYRYYRIIYRFIHNSSGVPIIIIGKGIDVDEKKRLEEQARFDSLTQCYSKINVEALITNRLKTRNSSGGALLFIDINKFKSFNEENGHFFGDEVLRQLAMRIKAWVLDRDVFGRIGGDEFVVYVANTDDIALFENRLDKLIFQLNERYSIFKTEADVRISVGVTLCKDCTSYKRCIQNADKALFIAKQAEKGEWLYYDESHQQYATSALSQNNKTEKISGLNMEHSIISSIFNILYERNCDIASISSALQYLGHKYAVGRCFIVESFDGGATYRFTHEWCDPSLPSHLQKQIGLPSNLLHELLEGAKMNEMFICEDINTCQLSGELPAKIAASGTKAFLHAQVKKDGIVTFFIGIEDCKNTRNWTDLEINTLHYLSRIFSIILQRKQLHQEVKILNDHSKLSAFVADNTDNFIYIVDPDTYDIIHMNQKALAMYGNPHKSEWSSQKCYEFLHGKTEPCEFCTNQYTTEHKFYEWKYYHPRFEKTYLFKDKLVPLNGKLVKLQVATDITKLVSLESELKDKLEEQTLLLNCIKMLHMGKIPNESIEEILRIVCEFFGAPEGMILQIAQDGLTVNGTHKWSGEQTNATTPILQNHPLAAIQPFLDKFNQTDAIYLSDLSHPKSLISPEYSSAWLSDIRNLIYAPILDDTGKLIGIFGVHNPTHNIDKYWLLGSLSVFVSDFLEKNKLIDSLSELSYYDTLTGVKNRHSYRKALLEIDEGRVSSLGVVYIDITGLSRINEEKGTRYGDEVIKRMAHILSDVFDESIFRVGGDEFVVLDKNVSELAFEGKINVLKNTLFEEDELKASVGFTWNNDFAEDKESKSDEYNTVRDSRNYTAMLSKNLDNEIASGKYVVFLQPQISFKTNKLDGAEALIRRIDASGNLQSPAFFVPFYEKEGMISKIDLHVFESVCKLLSGWMQRGIATQLKFSVNFSRATIMEKAIVKKLSTICEKYDVSPSMFVVEITETISHTDDKVFTYVISSLKNAGFCVSLDDFGSGHSNLSALQASDFDEIKLDMGLTRDIHLSAKSKTLAKVALNLCHELEGMVSVAEGIETIEQYDVLKNLNCHKGQGYYFSKPICISEFEQKYFGQNT